MVVQQQESPLRGLLLVALAGGWLGGILLDSFYPLPALSLFIGALAALVCVIPLRSDKQGRIVMLLIAAALLGGGRYSAALPMDDPHAISSFIGTGMVNIQGTVADEPKLTEHARILVINTSSISSNHLSQNVHGQITVITLGAAIETPYGANYGDQVELQGKLQPSSPQQAPGIFASMLFPRVHVSRNAAPTPISLLYHLRVYLATLITQLLPQPQAALLIALLLSLRTPMLHPVLQDFNVTGTAHLIAPSGFKVTIIAGMVMAFSARPNIKHEDKQGMKRRRRACAWRSSLKSAFVLLSISLYTLLSGAGPAAIRAGVMASIMIIAPRFGRVYNIYTALAFSALLMSIFDPFLLWDAGFLLSFLGTLGIVLLTPFFQRLFHPLEALPFGHQIVEIVASTFAAQVATLPVFAIIFQEVSLVAPLANILTVPLLGLLLTAGSILCILGICAPLLATLFAWALQPLLNYMLFITHWCANLPYAYITAPGLNIALAWCYYIVLTLLFIGGQTFFRPTRPLSPPPRHPASPPPLSPHTLRLLQIGAALLIMLVTGTSALAAQPDGRLSLLFLAVGQPAQGDALLIRAPDGKTALIDGGLDPVALAQQLDSRLPAWQRSLDMVILTTPRSEAIRGLQDIVSRYQIGAVFDAGMLHPTATYALWRHTIELRHIPYQRASLGMSIALGTQVALQVLSPPLPLHKSSDEPRGNALIFRLVSPYISLLFLGAAAQSAYALQTFLSNIALNYLRVQIVDIAEAKGEAFPVELAGVLQQAQPAYLMMTPALLNAKQRKNANSVTTTISFTSSATGSWQVERIAQVGTVEVVADGIGWSTSINQS